MAAKHKPNALTEYDLDLVLSERSQAMAIGTIAWTAVPSGAVVTGELSVIVPQDSKETARLKIGVNFYRPDEVTLAYLVNGVPAFRIDINKKHNGWPVQTHSHRYVPASGSEKSEKLPDFSPIPRGPTVAPGTWRRVFEDFANLVNVELSERYWTNPEGGSR